MKHLLAALALVSIVHNSNAQQAPGEISQLKQLEALRSQQVSSPNRITSITLANTSKLSDVNKLLGGIGLHSNTGNKSAIIWIDSTGRVIGRALGSSSILTSYENQLATLTGLEADQTCDKSGVCSYKSGGTRWSPYYSVYYLSTNCTGTPYLPYGGFGTPFVGIPVIDGDSAYIYILKVMNTSRVEVNSSYVNNTCHLIRGGSLPLDAAPVTIVVPASTFGTPPYFLK